MAAATVAPAVLVANIGELSVLALSRVTTATAGPLAAQSQQHLRWRCWRQRRPLAVAVCAAAAAAASGGLAIDDGARATSRRCGG